MSGPAFIAVVPAEVARFGAPASIVLALVRYRTGSDGPNRIERGDTRWWRATHRELARTTGLSLKAVRTALHALDGIVLANHFPPLSDQTLAYCISESYNWLASQSPLRAFADQPVAATGEASAGNGEVPRPYGRLHLSIRPRENEGEGNGWGEPLPSSPQHVDGKLGNEKTPTDAAPPSPWCSDHPGGTSIRCGPCRDARVRRQAYDEDEPSRRRRVNEARNREIASCPNRCAPYGRIDVVDEHGVEASMPCPVGHPQPLAPPRAAS